MPHSRAKKEAIKASLNNKTQNNNGAKNNHLNENNTTKKKLTLDKILKKSKYN